MTRARGSTPIVWMIAASVTTCAAAIAVGGSRVAPEVIAGMAAPLVSAVITWIVLERTHASAPERLTHVLITGFGIKVALFGAYVAVAIALLSLRPVPFVASFASYYVALHVAEAVLLKRLLAGQP